LPSREEGGEPEEGWCQIKRIIYVEMHVPTKHTQTLFAGFVVHKSKGVPTLSSMQEPLVPARLRQSKEKSNNDSKAEERGKSDMPKLYHFAFLSSIGVSFP
jgi:hypothetical protein